MKNLRRRLSAALSVTSIHRKILPLTALLMPLTATGRNVVYDPQVKTLQVVVNQDWLSPPVMRLGSDDVLNIGFDELSHNFHRYIYRLQQSFDSVVNEILLSHNSWLVGQQLSIGAVGSFNGHAIETGTVAERRKVNLALIRMFLVLAGLSNEGIGKDKTIAQVIAQVDHINVLAVKQFLVHPPEGKVLFGHSSPVA